MAASNQSCRVWTRFERKRKDGSLVKLRIQDTPESVVKNVVEFMIKYFPAQETFQKAAGVSTSPEAMTEYRAMLEEFIVPFGLVICCHDDTEEVGEVLGMTAVDKYQEEPFDLNQVKSEEMRKFFKMTQECENLVKPITNEFNNYHAGKGLLVHPDYRGLGIASELVKIRRLMMIEQNVSLSCTWMSAYGSQKAAEKDNWEIVYEVNSEELGKKYDVVFEDAPPTFKFYVTRNPNYKKE
ncbi:PREDICTED: uncharacterized protein LOC106106822 [Papilio polytes]|uniref:uncharacterized protein LOC106106822 n=1 Tax=Papilio polytes TaxID=76194 RepID=UPI000676A5F7|nr:PREDICTED: uncharacterized protein LOC106106822 [Papilio polytes]